MKRILSLVAATLVFFGCATNSNYKQKAIEYLKKHVPNPASVDTIKFLKPDSIYTTYHDTQEYRALMKGYNSYSIKDDSVKMAEIDSLKHEREKTYKKIVVGWDVKLIYKAKNKKGILTTDTCRFTFDSTLKIVTDLHGRSVS